MSTYKSLRPLWLRVVRAAQYQNYTPARMGRLDAGPAYVFDVPGGHNMTYVRIEQGEITTLAHAYNSGGVAETGDLRVWLDRNVDGVWIIVGVRYTG